MIPKEEMKDQDDNNNISYSNWRQCDNVYHRAAWLLVNLVFTVSCSVDMIVINNLCPTMHIHNLIISLCVIYSPKHARFSI